MFPADPGYARAITAEAARRSAQRLAKEGVIGRFALDFVVGRATTTAPGAPYAIEINLRKGGTTHPFLTLQFLTDGTYDAETRRLPHAPAGAAQVLRRDRPRRVAGAARRSRPTTCSTSSCATGCTSTSPGRPVSVLHMLSSLTEDGHIGLTAVGDTPVEADRIYRRAEKILLDEAAAALSDGPPIG